MSFDLHEWLATVPGTGTVEWIGVRPLLALNGAQFAIGSTVMEGTGGLVTRAHASRKRLALVVTALFAGMEGSRRA